MMYIIRRHRLDHFLFHRSIEECDHKYESVSEGYYAFYLPQKLKAFQFCAGNFDDNVRTHYGDSGVPAIIRFVLIKQRFLDNF